MTMKRAASGILVALLSVIDGCAVPQQKPQLTSSSGSSEYIETLPQGYAREAMAKGKARELLVQLEEQASQAEITGDWNRASILYLRVSGAALLLGQFQKAVRQRGFSVINMSKDAKIADG